MLENVAGGVGHHSADADEVVRSPQRGIVELDACGHAIVSRESFVSPGSSDDISTSCDATF